ncbi:MAG: hypothetical protein ACXAEU_04705 [Candidatus Hodarchaeales archaeon]|jgi:hypothetical protein
MKKIRLRKITLLSISLFFLLITISNTVTTPAFASQQTKELEVISERLTHYYDLNREVIGIFYDGADDAASYTGISLLESLSLLTADVIGYEVHDFDEIKRLLRENRVTIAIYVFQSDYKAMFINERLVEWSKVAIMVEEIYKTTHIFATGNTYQLLNNLPANITNVYGSGDEIADAQHMFVYALFTLASVLENSKEMKATVLAEEVRMATLKYFADNFNDLMVRNIEPQDQMGIDSPETKERRVNSFYEAHPEKVEKIATDGYVIDPELNREVDPETGEVRKDYLIDIIPKQALTSSDFPLFDVMGESGLRGPIGGILDLLLGLLSSEIGGVFGISQGTVDSIVSALGMIDDIVGIAKDPSGSKIKALIDELKPMLPISEDMMKYVDILIDALFLLRGDLDDIKGFILSVIDLLLGDLEIDGMNLKNILSSIFDLTAGIIDKIEEGGSFMDVILSVLNENILVNLTSKFLGNITGDLGATASQITSMTTKIVSTFKMVINFFSSFSIDKLITDYAPQLLSTAFSELGLDSKVINMMTKAMGLLFAGVGLIDTSYTDLLKSILEDIVPGTVTNRINRIKNMTENLVQEISDAISGDSTPSFSELQTGLNDVLNSIDLGLSTEIKSAINDIFTLLVALGNQDFSISGLLDTGEMIENILVGLGFDVSGTVDTVKKVINTVMGIIAFFKDPTGKMKEVMGNFLKNTSPKELIERLTKTIVAGAMEIEESALSSTSKTVIETASKAIDLIISIIGNVKDNPTEAILMTLLEGATYVLTQVTNVDIGAFVELGKGIFGQFLGLDVDPPSVDDILNALSQFLPSGILSSVRTFIEILNSVKSIFTDGFRFIFSQITAWLAGQITDLISSLSGSLGGLLSGEGLSFDIDLNIGFSGFSLFNLKVELGLGLGFAIDGEKLGDLIFDLVFKGVDAFGSILGADESGGVSGAAVAGTASAGDILRKAFSWLSLNPFFRASIELSDFGSDQGFFSFLLEAMGLELSFSGYGFFEMELFSFKNGKFDMDNFFKIIEWGFGFTIELSKTLTLLDFLTGGAGGSLNSIGKYIGLDAISITIMFGIALDIVKRAASGNQPETGSMTLAISIGVSVHLGIDIFIAELSFTGTLIVTLTFVQDLVTPTPLQIYLGIELIITVTIGFLFWDWDFDFHWSPYSGPHYRKELTSSKESAKGDGALGVDADEDGLGDEYELNTPGLNMNSNDSDNDGLTDKFETQVLKTDPANADTDGDGLTDLAEYEIKTNPLAPDTDFDQVDDYEEVIVYGTDPLSMDTDEDGLTDHYEIHHVWNITGITPSVSQIKIGNEYYDDRTDPLNPDSDADGLIDGEEGERGIYYGPDMTTNKTKQDAGMEDPPLIFNGGYTHPLDNDTDDDSYEQLYDGTISPRRRWLKEMNDYTEINGLYIVFIDTETGEPLEPRLVRTNPTNPDSDGDTGVTADQRINPPFAEFLLSDGYELATNPPSDPLDGDTDDDGLIDGYEGMLKSNSNHTWRLNPDTDGDGLGDREEVLLGTDGRSIDTDLDGVTDGDEFFIFGTNPFINDTDFDGLLDGEELWYYHSNPFMRDSDRDGIPDYDEAWIYMTDPMDEDSDNDFMTDYEEIYIHYTDPFAKDTDGDGLYDGEEIDGIEFYDPVTETNITLLTDPTKWDTDNDSLTTIDQFGEMSMSMSDGDEILTYKTNPTRTDTDKDGIHDGWELWLGKGIIPEDIIAEPLVLDPLNNDTDTDGLIDGQEVIVANRSTLLNPYIGFYLVFPYKTSPVSEDTDDDLLTDMEEIKLFFTDPTNNDTDNDTLTDYSEVYLYFTAAHKNDTDGDGLWDFEEIGSNRTYMTDPTNSDTDGDLLPDGGEIYFYGTDPLIFDENSNGILDGMEIDSDGDYLMDGEEYYAYETIAVPGGGPFQPDSDRDGLFDGKEAYEVGTSPIKWDTDNDTFSDGLEHYVGTDPLTHTSLEDMKSALEGALDAVIILSPTKTTYDITTIPVLAFDASGEVISMDYRYREVNGSWSSNIPMIANVSSPAYWSGSDLILPTNNATYEFEITGTKTDLTTITSKVEFNIELLPVTDIEIISPLANMTYKVYVIPINVRVGKDISNVTFSILFPNGTWTKNLTLEGVLGTYSLDGYTFPATFKLTGYAIRVYGETTGGDVVSREVSFSIQIPESLPVIISPTNMTYNANILPIKVSTDEKFASVSISILYPNGTWSSNETLLNMGNGTFYLDNYTLPFIYGLTGYIIRAYGETTGGDIVSSEVSFSIQITQPDMLTPIIIIGGGTVTLISLSGGGLLLRRRIRRGRST